MMRAFLAVVILGLLGLHVSCGGGDETQESIEDKYDRIVRDVSKGSTQSDIIDYLDSQDIVHGPVEVAGDYPQVRDLRNDISHDSPIVQAQIWGPDGPHGQLWEVYFLFDDSQRLADIATIQYGPTRP